MHLAPPFDHLVVPPLPITTSEPPPDCFTVDIRLSAHSFLRAEQKRFTMQAKNPQSSDPSGPIGAEDLDRLLNLLRRALSNVAHADDQGPLPHQDQSASKGKYFARK